MLHCCFVGYVLQWMELKYLTYLYSDSNENTRWILTNNVNLSLFQQDMEAPFLLPNNNSFGTKQTNVVDPDSHMAEHLQV